jgi:hypothetical protein
MWSRGIGFGAPAVRLIYVLGATMHCGQPILLALLSVAMAGSTSPEPAPIQQPAINYPSLSLRLNPGMSEQQVINLLGQPKKSDLTTCGQDVGKPWQCKLWTYGFPFGNGLTVSFRQEDLTGGWVVNNWQTSPG